MFPLHALAVCTPVVDYALHGSAAVHSHSKAAQLGLAWPQADNRLLEIIGGDKNLGIEMTIVKRPHQQSHRHRGDTIQIYRIRIRIFTKQLKPDIIMHITACKVYLSLLYWQSKNMILLAFCNN